MRRYLLDTNHASARWRNDVSLRGRMETTEDAEYGLCLPSIGELWFMVFNSAQVERNLVEMELLLLQSVIWEFDMAAAAEYGRIRTELRQVGRPIPAIDVQIAAIARVNELTVLTTDRPFSYVRDLLQDNWLVVEGT